MGVTFPSLGNSESAWHLRMKLAAIEFVIAALQLLALLVALVGLPLLSQTVRNVVVQAYAASAISRVRYDRLERAHSLSTLLCSRLLFNRHGGVSLPKTFLVALAETALLFVPTVALLGSIGTGSVDASGNSQPFAVSFPVPIVVLGTLLVQWALEYVVALGVRRLLAKRPIVRTLPLLLRVSCLLFFVWLAPTALALLLLTLGAWLRWEATLPLATWFLFNGPNLSVAYALAFKYTGTFVFALPLAASLTFSAGALAIAFSHAFLLSPIANRLLSAVVRVAGPGSGLTLIAVGSGLFAFLTDLSSSRSAIWLLIQSLMHT